MELLDDDTRSVLQVVDYAEQSGKPISPDEFDSFAAGPKRIVSTVGGIAAFAMVGERSTTETVLAFIKRAKLIEIDNNGGVRLTRLGRIVLSEADAIEQLANQAQDILLAARDEWATRDMLKAVGQAGPCLVVDPYCREPQVNDLARHTETTRVLVGPGVAKEDFELTLGRVRPPKKLELRVSGDIHVRHVVPDAGKVLAFGISLGGVGGRKPTIVVRLSDDMSRTVRATYEELWGKAEPWVLPPSRLEE
jgi:hypothetical protein